MDELFEVLYFIKEERLKPKPIIILNVDGYYDPLKQMFDKIFEKGLEKPEFMKLIRFVDTAEEVVPEAQKARKEIEGLDFTGRSKGDDGEQFVVAKEGFCAFDGGFGFYHKVFQNLCLMKIDVAEKKPFVFVKGEMSEPMRALLQNMVIHGFKSPADLRYVAFVNSPAEIKATFGKLATRINMLEGKKPSVNMGTLLCMLANMANEKVTHTLVK